MKYIWKITIRESADDAFGRHGYALAGSMGEALELAGHPSAVAIPQVHGMWPGAPGQSVCWMN